MTYLLQRLGLPIEICRKIDEYRRIAFRQEHVEPICSDIEWHYFLKRFIVYTNGKVKPDLSFAGKIDQFQFNEYVMTNDELRDRILANPEVRRYYDAKILTCLVLCKHHELDYYRIIYGAEEEIDSIYAYISKALFIDKDIRLINKALTCLCLMINGIPWYSWKKHGWDKPNALTRTNMQKMRERYALYRPNLTFLDSQSAQSRVLVLHD